MPESPAGDWMVSLDSMRVQRRNDMALFGSELVKAERGRAVYRLPITSAIGGGTAGGVHGGIMAAMTDISGVAAAITACKITDQPRGTAELNLSYLRPGTGTALFYTATVLKKGRSLAVVNVDIHNDSGTLVAKGRISYALGSVAPPTQK